MQTQHLLSRLLGHIVSVDTDRHQPILLNHRIRHSPPRIAHRRIDKAESTQSDLWLDSVHVLQRASLDTGASVAFAHAALWSPMENNSTLVDGARSTNFAAVALILVALGEPSVNVAKYCAVGVGEVADRDVVVAEQGIRFAEECGET